MLHTCISASANRNRILLRHVASFPLFFTTSGDVFCSKSSGVCETLWIFKVARCTRYMHENKQNSFCWQWCQAQSFILSDLNCKFGSVAYRGHPNKLTELHLWRFKLEILQSQLPHRPPKAWHSDVDISDWGFFNIFYAFIFEWKNQNLLDIQEHCICKLGKTRGELKLLFSVYYWFLKLSTGIIWHSYCPSHGIL